MADEDSFATVEQLESRWHALTDDERARATVLLTDATAYIKLRSPIWKDLQTENPRILEMAVCDAVVNLLQNEANGVPAGVSQSTQTAGPFSESYSWSNPNWGIYLPAETRKTLRIGGQRAFSIDMASGEVSR